DVTYAIMILVPGECVQNQNHYRVSHIRDVYVLHQSSADWSELPQYLFSLNPQKASDFVPICQYKWTSPNSKFTGSRMCSRVTLDGRITLTETSLITIADGQRIERPLQGEDEFAFWLHECFDFG